MNFGTNWRRAAVFNIEGGGSAAGSSGEAGAAGNAGGAAGAASEGAAASAGAGGAAEQTFWYSNHPDQAVRDMMAAKRFDTPDTLGTAYLHATRALNGATDVVAIPPSGASQEQMDAYYGRLGRPAEATGYDLSAPEGAQNDTGMEAWARDTFFKAGLSSAQARSLYEAWNQHAAGSSEEYARSSAAAVSEVRQKWGAEADHMISSGKQAVRALGLDAATLDAIERSAGTAPMLDLLAQLGKRMGGESGSFVSGNSGGAPTDPANMTSEQAAQAIAALQADKDFMEAYRTAGHPQQKTNALRLEKLYSVAYTRR